MALQSKTLIREGLHRPTKPTLCARIPGLGVNKLDRCSVCILTVGSMHVFDGLTRVLCVLLCGSTRKHQDATQVRPERAIACLRLRLSPSTCEPVLSDCAMSSTCAPVPHAELMPDRDPDLLISRSEAEDRVVLTRDRYAWCSVSLVALLCSSVLCPAHNLACRHAVVCWNQETLGPKRRQGAVLHSLSRHSPPVYNRTWWCEVSRRMKPPACVGFEAHALRLCDSMAAVGCGALRDRVRHP